MRSTTDLPSGLFLRPTSRVWPAALSCAPMAIENVGRLAGARVPESHRVVGRPRGQQITVVAELQLGDLRLMAGELLELIALAIPVMDELVAAGGHEVPAVRCERDGVDD